MTPDQMRQAATKLREMATAALDEMRDSEYFDYDPANFGPGIDNACGGEVGKLAAMFGPGLEDQLELMAHRTEKVGPCDAKPHACNNCAEPDWTRMGASAIAETILIVHRKQRDGGQSHG